MMQMEKISTLSKWFQEEYGWNCLCCPRNAHRAVATRELTTAAVQTASSALRARAGFHKALRLLTGDVSAPLPCSPFLSLASSLAVPLQVSSSLGQRRVSE